VVREGAVGYCRQSRYGSSALIGRIGRSREWGGIVCSFGCINGTGRDIDKLHFLLGDLHELEGSRMRTASIGAGVVSCLIGSIG
jgi:hypothetical protein